MKMARDDKDSPGLLGVTVDSVQALTPHTRVLYEAGASLLADSVKTSREFCKSLIGIGTGAIPIYLATLALVLPDNYHPTVAQGLRILTPVAAFLLAAICAAVGYLPKTTELSLEILEEIRTERNRLIRWRRTAGIIAFVLFLLAVCGAIAIVVVSAADVAGSP
jgi:hypothetical protein